MKRWWILLLTFGVVFALAVPVAAKQGGPDCDLHPNHATCAGDPAAEEPDSNWGIPCGQLPDDLVVLADGVSSEFKVYLGGRKIVDLPGSACVDVMSNEGPWTVEVEVLQGTLKSMAVFIRDGDSPGDGCFPGGSCGLGLGPRDIPEGNSFTLDKYLDDVTIPEAYVNACNVFDDGNLFGEWTVNEFGDPVEFYEGIWPDIPSPLGFMPSISGTNDLLVTLTVTFPTHHDDIPPD
jgi:hypothetical protein